MYYICWDYDENAVSKRELSGRTLIAQGGDTGSPSRLKLQQMNGKGAAMQGDAVVRQQHAAVLALKLRLDGFRPTWPKPWPIACRSAFSFPFASRAVYGDTFYPVKIPVDTTRQQ